MRKTIHQLESYFLAFVFMLAIAAASYGILETSGLLTKIAAAAIAISAVVLALVPTRFPIVDKIGASNWLFTWFAIGLFARVLWGVTGLGEFASDSKTYWTLAKALASGDAYWIHGGRAYWPPGLPLFLAPFIYVFGPAAWVPTIANTLLYIATFGFLWKLCEVLGGRKAANIAVFLFAVWPTSILMVWMPSKELLSLALVLAAAYAYVIERPTCCGVALGAAALVHPALLFLPAAFFAWTIYSGELRLALRRFTMVIIAMLVVVAPWTIRNYLVLGQPVLISTNGGVNLYIGNNPTAGGRFQPIDLESKFPGASETERDRLAKGLAVEWIKANPTAFIALSIKRVALYLEDDSSGAYWAIKRGHEITGASYKAAEAASNLYWIFLLALSLRGVLAMPGAGGPAGICFCYGIAIAAVFFGHTNHHIAYTGFVLILASVGALARGPMLRSLRRREYGPGTQQRHKQDLAASRAAAHSSDQA